MPRSATSTALSYLGTAAYLSNKATQISRNTDYWSNKLSSKYKTMPKRGVRTYGKTKVRSGRYATGPRTRGTMPLRLPPSLLFKQDNLIKNHGSNPISFSLTDISAGDNGFNRDGRIVRIMNLRGTLRAVTGVNTRVVIYQPLDPTDRVTMVDPHDPVDPNKFRVLFDKYWHPENNAGNAMVYWNLNFGKYGKLIHYDGTLASDNTTPLIHMYIHNSSLTGTHFGNNTISFVDAH